MARLIWKRDTKAVKLFRQIQSIGSIRAALLVALLRTPPRFRTKGQLWAYSGFAVQTHESVFSATHTSWQLLSDAAPLWPGSAKFRKLRRNLRLLPLREPGKRHFPTAAALPI
jgi:hypothetical protein